MEPKKRFGILCPKRAGEPHDLRIGLLCQTGSDFFIKLSTHLSILSVEYPKIEPANGVRYWTGARFKATDDINPPSAHMGSVKLTTIE